MSGPVLDPSIEHGMGRLMDHQGSLEAAQYGSRLTRLLWSIRGDADVKGFAAAHGGLAARSRAAAGHFRNEVAVLSRTRIERSVAGATCSGTRR